MGWQDDAIVTPPEDEAWQKDAVVDEPLPEVIATKEGGNGLVAKINAMLGGKPGVSERPSQLGVETREAAPEGAPFVRGFGESVSHVVPQSWGELGGLAESFLPPIEAYRQTKQGFDIASGKPAPEVIPGITELKDLEDIKAEYGGDSPEYQSAAGKAAGNVLSQMIMAGLVGKGLQVPTPNHYVGSRPPPDLPPSPSMGPGTIAGDVSRALERRFTLQEPPPEPPLAPAPPIEDTLANIPKEPPVFNPELGPQTIPEFPMPLKTEGVQPISPAQRNGQILAERQELLNRQKDLKQRFINGEHGVAPELEATEAKINASPVVHAPPAVEQRVQHGQFEKPGYTAVDTPTTGGEGTVWYHSGELPEGGEPNMPLYLHRSREWAEDYGRSQRSQNVTRQFKVKGKIRELKPGERDELVWNSPYSESFRQQLIKEGYVGVSDPLGSPNAQLAVIDPRALEPVPLEGPVQAPETPASASEAPGGVPVAEPAPATPVLEIPAEDVKYAGGEPEPQAPQAFSEEPHVSSIANRFTTERAAAGELGEIAPGESVNTMDLVHHGLKMSPEKVNESISRIMQGGDVPINDAAAIRGEEARLSQRSGDLSRAARFNPSPEAQLAADNAFKDLTDFHNGPVAQAKRNWHHQGKLMQGEIPVDLSTLNGMREAWLKDTGKPPPAHVEPKLQRAADKLAKAIDEEQAATRNGGDAIEKATRGRKLPTAEEVRNNIAERMKVEPCII